MNMAAIKSMLMLSHFDGKPIATFAIRVGAGTGVLLTVQELSAKRIA
jgi:hypothetical protein